MRAAGSSRRRASASTALRPCVLSAIRVSFATVPCSSAAIALRETSTTVEASCPSSASSRTAQEAPTSFEPGSARTDSRTRHIDARTLASRPCSGLRRSGLPFRSLLALVRGPPSRFYPGTAPRAPWATGGATPCAGSLAFCQNRRNGACRLVRQAPTGRRVAAACCPADQTGATATNFRLSCHAHQPRRRSPSNGCALPRSSDRGTAVSRSGCGRNPG
jgi:hypothetical protein